jgi:adenine-specific DNA-methyltransferase
MIMIHEQSDELPTKGENQTLTDYAEILSDWYVRHQPLDYRKKRGQYFTPKRVSEFMAQLIDDIHTDKELRILDPGAGVGNFESALCEYAKAKSTKVHLSFDLYEDCEDMIPLLKVNMRACLEIMAQKGLDISYRIFKENFILAHAAEFRDETRNRTHSDEFLYDLVICNPPYYKLKRNSPEAVAMKRIVKGQPNIYVLFMAMAAKLMKDGGQLVILTPRSYCTGDYFSEFRKWFFGQITPVRLHEFESRRLLKNDAVLQEMLILKGEKGCEQPDNVTISVSYKEPNQTTELVRREVPFDMVVVSRGGDIQIRVPTTNIEELVAKEVEKLQFTLTDLGFKASTGPVVPFRAKEHLLNTVDDESESAPLIWMENIDCGRVFWPLPTHNKPMALRLGEKTSRLCIPNSNYVLIKRFSAKEGKRRINAGVIIKRWLNAQSIAIENHVNYIHKVGANLTEDEAYGLAEIFNSKLYNLYFQISNGSTQVNVSELNRIPLPSSDLITKIGQYTRETKTGESTAKQRFIMTALGIAPAIIDRLLGDY